ncbi:hypothetical protein ABZW38_27310 [Streptomyces bacillaris]|uniref:hypothetical protein n=1 Tax=Streptomyces bacillaris TaxID=68179 RepID=UPI00345F4968
MPSLRPDRGDDQSPRTAGGPPGANRVIRAFVRDRYEEERFRGANTELTSVRFADRADR